MNFYTLGIIGTKNTSSLKVNLAGRNFIINVFNILTEFDSEKVIIIKKVMKVSYHVSEARLESVDRLFEQTSVLEVLKDVLVQY